MRYKIIEIRARGSNPAAIDDFVKFIAEAVGRYGWDVEWEIKIMHKEMGES